MRTDNFEIVFTENMEAARVLARHTDIYTVYGGKNLDVNLVKSLESLIGELQTLQEEVKADDILPPPNNTDRIW